MAKVQQNGEPNGVVVEEVDEGEKEKNQEEQIETMEENHSRRAEEEETLYVVLHRLFTSIFFPDPKTSESTMPSLIHRIKSSLYENGPSIREAFRNSTKNLILWTRQGSPLRAILVISVGTVTLLTLTGLLLFMLFFLAATINAIIISLLMSLAAAGGFLAIFFACTTAIYIGALSVAVFAISTATITSIIAVLIATGWVTFFWAVWWAAKKSIGLVERSLNMTSSALSAYSASRQAHHAAPEKEFLVSEISS